jgi:hypothetical protein
MTAEYLSQLYKDFDVKEKSIRAYVVKIDENSKTIDRAVYEWLTLLKRKHEIIQDFRDARQKTVPSSNFSLENTGGTAAQTSNENLKDLEASIQEKAKTLNHLYARAEKEMTFLTQSFKGSMDLVNQINDHFEELFKGM